MQYIPPPLYPLPAFLKGVITSRQYCKWLNAKAHTLVLRDRKRGKPYAGPGQEAVYQALVHLAVVNSEGRDPYTGEKLAWELVSTWDISRKHPEGYEKKFSLLPTVDHVVPDTLEFEICSWQINKAKSDLTPAEFLELCKKVVGHFSNKIVYSKKA